MKIVSCEVSIVEIPFTFPGTGVGIMPTAWKSLEFCLVRLEDELGNIGWGEGFGYFTVDATKAIIERLIKPRLVGSTVDDIPAWNRQIQRDIHMFGRYGVTVFAISGVDIALWDLAARRAQMPLYERLRTDAEPKQDLAAYVSLMRYGQADLVAQACNDVLEAGYTAVKLHETGLREIEAGRHALGASTPMSVDVNCQWTSEFIARNRPQILDLDLAWLEEPIFPPEDLAALEALRSAELPLAAGENWSTAFQFAAAAEAVDIWQPSVTKVGGISVYLEILKIAAGLGKRVVPHCPYFGAGLFATLHLAAVSPQMDHVEINWCDPDAWLADIEPLRTADRLLVPQTVGTGFEPDSAVFERYRRA